MIKINKAPVLTSKNYGINFFEASDDILEIQTKPFENCLIKNNEDVKVENLTNLPQNNLSVELDLQNKSKCNFSKKITISKSSNKPLVIDLELTDALVDTICLEILKNVDAKVILKHTSNETVYHNLTLKIVLKDGATLQFAELFALETNSKNFVSVEFDCENYSQLKYDLFDFCNENSVQNVKINLLGNFAKADFNSLYFGNNTNKIGLNYLINQHGKKTCANMKVFGILNDSATKNFVGTLNFVKGSNKSKGTEDEFCFMLSDNAKSKSTPILLTGEEDVDGTHSSSIGFVDENIVFYAMSRGLSKQEAIKMMVKAKIATVTNNIFDDDFKNLVESIIDNKLN